MRLSPLYDQHAYLQIHGTTVAKLPLDARW